MSVTKKPENLQQYGGPSHKLGGPGPPGPSVEPRLTSQYQNISILDFIGAKDGGGSGDNWSYKMCKALVK